MDAGKLDIGKLDVENLDVIKFSYHLSITTSAYKLFGRRLWCAILLIPVGLFNSSI